MIQAQLDAEKAVLKKLERQYQAALNDINQKVKLFDYDISMLDEAAADGGLDDAARAVLASQKRSKVYQKQYQEAMKGQIEGILDKLHGDEYATIQQYLHDSYNDAFLGTMYDLHGQGIPLIMPIDQAAAVKAIQTDSKISEGLYKRLGVDTKKLKKDIASEVTRGIATGLSYTDMARNISNAAKAPLSRANVIARTESHRIQQASTMDVQNQAKKKGADVVKQWDATLDGVTRPTHRQLDGQIREIDEPFEAGGKKAMYPGDFGDPAEDCNCRCASLTRARWALDEDELKTLQDRAAFFGLDKTEDFEDFKKKYNIAVDQAKEVKHLDITDGGRYEQLSISDRNQYADRIEHEYTTQKASIKEVNMLWQTDGGYIQNSQGYSDINSFLRGLKPKLDNPKCHLTMNVMKRLTNNNSLQKDYIGFRKVDSNYLANVLGLDVGGLFKFSIQKNSQGSQRAVNVPKNKESAEVIAGKLKKLVGTESAVIKDDGFTSVSLSDKLNYFTHYPIEFKIQMPKGTKGFITSNLDESEFIAKNGSSLEILDAYVYNDGGKECVAILAKMLQ